MAPQVSKNIQALADAAEEKRRQQEQGFAPSAPSVNYGGGWEADMKRMIGAPVEKRDMFYRGQPDARDMFYRGQPDATQLEAMRSGNPAILGSGGAPDNDLIRSFEQNLINSQGQASRTPFGQAGVDAGNQFRDSILSSIGEQQSAVAPEALAGLGLGGGFVASQVGGQASTSSKLSPFAQQVAAADTSRLNAPINPPKGNPILGRNVPTNPLNPSVGPMTSQPSLATAQGSANRAAGLAASRGPSALSKAGSLARTAAGGPLLAYTAADLGVEAMTGKGISERAGEGIGGAIGSFLYGDTSQPAFTQEELAASIANMPQQQQPIAPILEQLGRMAQGSLINPPSAAEAGDNLINIGNSLFPNEAPVNLMTQGGPTETQERRRAKPFGTTPTEPTFPQLKFSETDTGRGRGRRGADLTMRAKPEATDMTQPAPSVNETTATANTTTTDGMDITQRAMTEAMDGTAKTNAQRSELSPAQQNFLTRKDEGTPLKPDEIIAAQRYAVSQGQIFDPETGYSQAEFYGQRYKGQSIGDYLRGADTPQGATEQFVDPQGRLRRRMAGTDQLAPEYSSYERESAAREARLAARPDFMKARPSQARKDGVMSMAQAVKVAGGDRKKAAAMIELQKMGRDPLTGQPEKPEGMDEYQRETIRQNQERIDLAKEEAEAAREAAKAAREAAAAAGATQAEKNAYDIAQRKVNLATTYQKLLEDQEAPVFDAKDIEADLDSISDQLNIIYDPESGVFRRGKIWGKGEVIKLDDPKNASIVRTIGTYKVGKALLDKYPKKG
jgi:hypothetical protein